MMKLALVALAGSASAFSLPRVVSRVTIPLRAASPVAVADLPPEAFQVVSSGVGLEEAFGAAGVLGLGYMGMQMMTAPKDDDVPKKRSSFGWLQADMRVPLPKYEDLQLACHLVGVDGKNQMYLCSAQSKSSFSSCDISDDFTQYYGHTVYVCTGGNDPRSKDNDIVT